MVMSLARRSVTPGVIRSGSFGSFPTLVDSNPRPMAGDSAVGSGYPECCERDQKTLYPAARFCSLWDRVGSKHSKSQTFNSLMT